MTQQTQDVWVITNAYAGIVNQALGLAERVVETSEKMYGECLALAHKVVELKPLWRMISPYVLWGGRYAPTHDSDVLHAPWPRLIIAAGRHAILPALWVKSQSQATKVLYLQDPRMRYDAFDAIVCPYHDYVAHDLARKGGHILPILGATHRVTHGTIEAACTRFASTFAALSAPRISVMIGGENKLYHMDLAWAQMLVAHLVRLHTQHNASLLITCSRRTPHEVQAYLRSELSQKIPPHALYLYTGEGDNPYMALLGMGDILLVTCESVSMISEACSTTKPVYMIPLPQKKSSIGKFQIFHTELKERKRIQWLPDLMQRAHLFNMPVYTPLDDHDRAVACALMLLGIHIANPL